MKLCTYEMQTGIGPVRRTGVVTAAGIVDAAAARAAFLEATLPAAAAARVGAAQCPVDMLELIGAGQQVLDWLAEAAEFVTRTGRTTTGGGVPIVHAGDAVRLLAPVPRPPGIANFSVWPAHSANAATRGVHLTPAAAGAAVKTYWKGNPDSTVGTDTVLRIPAYADMVDVECEFAAVVGTGGRDLDRAAAERAIVGYTILNDTSARDIQLVEMKSGRGPSKGKDFDTGNVQGPWIVTRDEMDPKAQTMALVVNGEVLSSCETAGMVWEFAEMLSYMSTSQTIYPGQIISAGCYAGGSAREVNRVLKEGDVVEMRITGIGALRSIIGGKA